MDYAVDYAVLALAVIFFVVSLVLVRLLLRRNWLRPRQRPTRPMQELQREYGKWEAVCALAYLLLTALICFVWASLLAATGGGLTSDLEGELVLTPEPVLWYVPSLFLGLGLAAMLTPLAMRLLLKQRFEEYRIFSAWRLGLDPQKILPLLVGVFLLASVGFSVLLPDCYTVFTRQAIVHDPVFGFAEETYPYEKIAELKVGIEPRPYRNELRIEAVMDDGRVWKSEWAPAPIYEDQWELVEVIESGME